MIAAATLNESTHANGQLRREKKMAARLASGPGVSARALEPVSKEFGGSGH